MRRNSSSGNPSFIASAKPLVQFAPSTCGRATSIRQLIDHAPTAMFVFQGKKNVYVSPAAEQLTGYSSHELLRMAFWEIMHPDFRMVVKERGSARQRGAKIATRYEVKIVRKDGGERWLDYFGAAIT